MAYSRIPVGFCVGLLEMAINSQDSWLQEQSVSTIFWVGDKLSSSDSPLRDWLWPAPT